MADIGTVIDGKYEILKEIGQGGMSKVYLAMDLRLNKQWAIKEIEKFVRDKSNEVMIQSLIAEANLMKKLDHSALPRIVDIISQKETILVIMDYIEGEPLSRLLEEEGPQSQEMVIDWAKQLCRALDYLHTCNPPIIYRDIKPANVILQPGGSMKLIDFGTAREYKEGQKGDTVNLGTKGYAAPEQFSRTEQTDARTDIYCLGVTMYHLLTGQDPCEEPYKRYPIRCWNPSLSGGLENIIEKCTRQNPADRYQSCIELLYDLDHYEEVDDMFRNHQRRKMIVFTSMTVCTLLFLLLGTLTMALSNISNNSQYETKMKQAQQIASNDSEKANLLIEAIGIKPDAMEAYKELIDTCKADAEFSLKEEEQLKKCLNANLNRIQSEKGYPELAFEIGKLYWHYYSYGMESSKDNRATRVKSAARWFEDALKFSKSNFKKANMAKVYMEIGNFQNRITTAIEEASDQGTYKPYWNSLDKLLEVMERDRDENEIVCMELCKLIIDSLENYSRKFKADGISKTQLLSVYVRARKEVEQVDISTDKTEDLKNEIVSRYEYVEEAIEHAYLVQE